MSDVVRLLLVEDDEALSFIVKDNLEQHAFVVDVAGDGQEAITCFDQNRYHLIILDVMLPKIDGFKVAEYIRLKDEDVPIFILGNGTNLLVSDFGIEGAVIHINGGMDEIKLTSAFDIECEAGVKLSKLCNFALENSLSGLEFAWGIPGSAGGAAYMNAGAYDSKMSEIITSAEHISLDGIEGRFEGDELEFGYRKSVYHNNKNVITLINLKLSPGRQDNIMKKMEELITIRKSKQPLEFPSAGSVFKRPTGNFAGTLIEECGLKGRSVKGAMVSEKHAGFIINTGGATCSDVRQLIEIIKEEVFLNKSIKLETEIKPVGRM